MPLHPTADTSVQQPLPAAFYCVQQSGTREYIEATLEWELKLQAEGGGGRKGRFSLLCPGAGMCFRLCSVDVEQEEREREQLGELLPWESVLASEC